MQRGRGRGRKYVPTTLGKAPPASSFNDENNVLPDRSELLQPIGTSVSGLKQVLCLYETATEEVKYYLSFECDVIYECKKCRSLHRSIANFILHKREFCKGTYSPPKDATQSIIHSPVPKSVPEKTIASVISKMEVQQICDQLCTTAAADKDEMILTPVKGNTIALETIEQNKSGVFQTLLTSSGEEEEEEEDNKEHFLDKDLTKSEVEEIHKVLNNNIAVLTPDGKISNLPGNSLHLVCKFCRMRFATKKTLTHHVKYKHNDTRIVYLCPENNCNADVFSNTWSVFRHLYKVHRKTHTQVKKLRGLIQTSVLMRRDLEKRVPPRGNKNALKRLITDDKRWMDNYDGDGTYQVCGGCGKRFERRAALNAHSQTCQANKRPFFDDSDEDAEVKEKPRKMLTDKIHITTKTVVEDSKEKKKELTGSRKRKAQHVVKKRPVTENDIDERMVQLMIRQDVTFSGMFGNKRTSELKKDNEENQLVSEVPKKKIRDEQSLASTPPQIKHIEPDMEELPKSQPKQQKSVVDEVLQADAMSPKSQPSQQKSVHDGDKSGQVDVAPQKSLTKQQKTVDSEDEDWEGDASPKSEMKQQKSVKHKNNTIASSFTTKHSSKDDNVSLSDRKNENGEQHQHKIDKDYGQNISSPHKEANKEIEQDIQMVEKVEEAISINTQNKNEEDKISLKDCKEQESLNSQKILLLEKLDTVEEKEMHSNNINSEEKVSTDSINMTNVSIHLPERLNEGESLKKHQMKHLPFKTKKGKSKKSIPSNKNRDTHEEMPISKKTNKVPCRKININEKGTSSLSKTDEYLPGNFEISKEFNEKNKIEGFTTENVTTTLEQMSDKKEILVSTVNKNESPSNLQVNKSGTKVYFSSKNTKGVKSLNPDQKSDEDAPLNTLPELSTSIVKTDAQICEATSKNLQGSSPKLQAVDVKLKAIVEPSPIQKASVDVSSNALMSIVDGPEVNVQQDKFQLCWSPLMSAGELQVLVGNNQTIKQNMESLHVPPILVDKESGDEKIISWSPSGTNDQKVKQMKESPIMVEIESGEVIKSKDLQEVSDDKLCSEAQNITNMVIKPKRLLEFSFSNIYAKKSQDLVRSNNKLLELLGGRGSQTTYEVVEAQMMDEQVISMQPILKNPMIPKGVNSLKPQHMSSGRNQSFNSDVISKSMKLQEVSNSTTKPSSANKTIKLQLVTSSTTKSKNVQAFSSNTNQSIKVLEVSGNAGSATKRKNVQAVSGNTTKTMKVQEVSGSAGSTSKSNKVQAVSGNITKYMKLLENSGVEAKPTKVQCGNIQPIILKETVKPLETKYFPTLLNKQQTSSVPAQNCLIESRNSLLEPIICIQEFSNVSKEEALIKPNRIKLKELHKINEDLSLEQMSNDRKKSGVTVQRYGGIIDRRVDRNILSTNLGDTSVYDFKNPRRREGLQNSPVTLTSQSSDGAVSCILQNIPDTTPNSSPSSDIILINDSVVPDSITKDEIVLLSDDDDEELITLEMKAAPYMDQTTKKCVPCNKLHNTVDELLKHMATHFKWFHFQCNECLFKSYDHGTLREHLMKQHRIPPRELERYTVRLTHHEIIKNSVEFQTLLFDEGGRSKSSMAADPSVQRMIMEVIFGSSGARPQTGNGGGS